MSGVQTSEFEFTNLSAKTVNNLHVLDSIS